jgi:ABC-type transport system involved in multi-copper enzyme maturation permease subunit
VKYLAMLKDSFREAVDTKVFFVMIALSALLALIVASVGFKPRPVAELPEFYTTGPLNLDPSKLNPNELLNGQFPPHSVNTGYFRQISAAPAEGFPDRPDSPLRFVVRARYDNAQEAAKVKAFPDEAQQFIKERFAAVKDWKIVAVDSVRLIEAPAENQLDFEVMTHATRSTLRVWPHQPSLFFGAVPLTSAAQFPLGLQIWFIEDRLVNAWGGWVAIIVSIVLTAFFIPNMLRKGTVDLLLVKPIHRSTLLIYKYIGGLMFILLNTTLAIGLVWLILSLRSGIWTPAFLLSIPMITFFFAILYSVSTLAGVLSQSPIVSIVITVLAWAIFFGVGTAYVLPEVFRQQEDIQKVPDEERISNGRWVDVVKALHFVFPRVKDLDFLTSRYLFRDLLTANQTSMREPVDANFSWTESLGVDLGFIAVMIGLACWRFATKDY